MQPLLIIREFIIRFYKRFEPVISVLLRFALGFYIFSLIQDIGHIRPELAEYYNLLPISIVLILAIAFVVLPLSISYLLIIVDITIQYSSNIEVAAIIFVFLLCIFLFYARMAVKESILILLTIVAYRYGLIYLVPFIAGMYFSVTAIIPVAIAVFLISFMPNIAGVIETTYTADLSFTDMPATFGEVYEAMVYALQASSDWVVQAFILGIVIILINIISKFSIPFAKEIAIALGAIVMICGFIVANTTGATEVGAFGIILPVLLCAFIAWFARLFDPILDYKRAESVRFEDDTNYYYVRAVPKIQLSKTKKASKKRVSFEPEPIPSISSDVIFDEIDSHDDNEFEEED